MPISKTCHSYPIPIPNWRSTNTHLISVTQLCSHIASICTSDNDAVHAHFHAWTHFLLCIFLQSKEARINNSAHPLCTFSNPADTWSWLCTSLYRKYVLAWRFAKSLRQIGSSYSMTRSTCRFVFVSFRRFCAAATNLHFSIRTQNSPFCQIRVLRPSHMSDDELT